MADLLFGTAGIPISTWPQSTTKGINRVAELGLDCMELEFVQGVYLEKEDAIEVAEMANKTGIRLSAHAPYFLNFNAHEPKKIRASQGILFKAAYIASICGAESIIFHAGFYLGDPPQEAYNTIKNYLFEVITKMKEQDIQLLLRPEVSGKSSQFGSLEEILQLCSELEGTAPCIDFAHLHARSGRFNSYPEFFSILEQVRGKLGDKALKNMHLHISGIEFGTKGERKHLELQESDLQYGELLRALKEHNISGMIICESPNQEEDALLLKTGFHTLS
ncbi:MAG: TIM barrel protein [Dehalococcoidia bacterium]|nr:MAG: TIM barrel protein [Dehalococcoidia bacterium]